MATLKADRIWIPLLRGKCVSYLRTSELPYSRLNEEAQRASVKAMLPAGRSSLIGEFIEHEPLTVGRRPALEQAVQLCKDQKATLLLVQIERMRSAVRWLGYVQQEGVKFRGVDAPHINQLSYNRLVVADLHWRGFMAHQVRHSLTKVKEHGAVLGGDRSKTEGLRRGPAASAKARGAMANRRDISTMADIELIRYRGITSLTGIAKRLNQMGRRAPRGGEWSPSQVRIVIRKFEE